MFRRRTSSPGKIHYRVNINKNMCLGVVDIYTDLSSGCESYAYGKSSHGNYRVTVRIV